MVLAQFELLNMKVPQLPGYDNDPFKRIIQVILVFAHKVAAVPHVSLSFSLYAKMVYFHVTSCGQSELEISYKQ